MDLKQALLDFYQTSALYLLDKDAPDVCDKSRKEVKSDAKGKPVRVYYKGRSSTNRNKLKTEENHG